MSIIDILGREEVLNLYLLLLRQGPKSIDELEYILKMGLGDAFEDAYQIFHQYTPKMFGNQKLLPKEFLRFEPLLRLLRENESDIHTAMKIFICYSIFKERGVIPEVEDKKIYADVSIQSQGIYYEAETLYDIGKKGVFSIRKRIFEKLKKYENINARRVIFAFRNISLLLHLKDLAMILKDIRENRSYGEKLDVRFCGFKFSINDQEKIPRVQLIPLEDIIRRLIKYFTLTMMND